MSPAGFKGAAAGRSNSPLLSLEAALCDLCGVLRHRASLSNPDEAREKRGEKM